MSDKRNRQFERLRRQHELAGGPAGIFGYLAREHDIKLSKVMDKVFEGLQSKWPFSFRHRKEIPKKEINAKLSSVDVDLGKVLFVESSRIRPDGGLIEVMDRQGDYRAILTSESKHQGNDVQKILAGEKQGKNKDQDLMVAGNAIERVHKNIQEFRNFMINEKHFPYVVFLQGSNFATETFFVRSVDGRDIKIAHDAGNMNRIDRVSAASYGMDINRNYCRNAFVELDGHTQMLQAASLYFQADTWYASEMAEILWEVALTSLEILFDDLVEN
ncbi:MAG: restriction endonuclease [Chloroflexi bacterium]|nr:restriction endonuclease [Chloroflexota bacterium]